MEQEIINKAKEMLTNADTGTNDCKHYNNGFMDGVEYTIKALRQPIVSGSCRIIKTKFQYETKSKIQMERGRSNGKTCLLLMARWFAIQNTNWIFR